MVFVAMGTSAAVIVGLLNGACGSSGGGYYAPPPGYCWYPGVCREVTERSLCRAGESFAEGHCDDTLRVGWCAERSSDRRVYLYAPLHGLGFGEPDCTRIAGPGTYFVGD
jgi:hypothetical protein